VLVRESELSLPFINAVLEIADASHKAHQVSINLRESIRQSFVRLAVEAGVKSQISFRSSICCSSAAQV